MGKDQIFDRVTVHITGFYFESMYLMRVLVLTCNAVFLIFVLPCLCSLIISPSFSISATVSMGYFYALLKGYLAMSDEQALHWLCLQCQLSELI